MRVRSIDTPPRIALTCPSSELPMPNGIIGTPCRGAGRDHPADLGRAFGKHHRIGRGRGMPRLAMAVMFADRGRGGDAVAGHGAQVGNQGIEG